MGPRELARLHGTLIAGNNAPAAALAFSDGDDAANAGVDASTAVPRDERLATIAASNPFATSDPFATIDIPAIDCVFVGDVKVARGSAVRLRPKRRADVWDAFLDGKLATVRAIHQTVEDETYVAVTVDDDPASDLHDWYGRSLFFAPDEVEPLAAAAPERVT
jgi:hypothetical protein